MRTEDITSISQHRANLREHLDQIKRTGRPMFITNKSGETEAVILSAEDYDRLVEQIELSRSLQMLDRSMEDIRAGRTHDARQAIREIADDLGLRLSR